MRNIYAMIKRNCVLFLRSKQVVFFSFFSALILIVLYFLFIANLYAQGFNESAGMELSSNQINFAIYVQMIMGVLVINSVSLSTGMFTFMAEDLEKSKTDAFLMTNAKPFHLVISYLVSGFLVSFILNFLMLALSIIIIGASTTFWLGAGAFFSVMGALLLTSFIGCSVMLLITILVKSSPAMGVINGILGTLLGFLCGIYMPYSNMGKGVAYVGSLLPFTHLSIWLKQLVLTDAFAQLGMTNQISQMMQDKWFSAGNIGFLGMDLPLWAMLLISSVFAFVCLVIAVLLFKRSITKKTVKKRKIKLKG